MSKEKEFDMQPIVLTVLDDKLAVCRLNPNEPVSRWAAPPANFLSVTLTKDEISIVCPSEKVPEKVPEEVKCEKDWIAFKIEGPLDFGLIGILASIAKVLADAKISIFSISTYDTGYILVKEKSRQQSIEALKKAGYKINQ